MQESEGIKTTSVQIREPLYKRQVFHVFVLMHACTHLYGTSMGACVGLLPACCCKGAELSTMYTMLTAGLSMLDWYVKILDSFKPKHRSCSCLWEQIMHGILKIRPLWHLFNGTAVVFPPHMWFCNGRQQGDHGVTVKISSTEESQVLTVVSCQGVFDHLISTY